MPDSFSSRLQVSETKALVASDPEQTLNELVRTHCQVAVPERVPGLRTKKEMGVPYIRARVRKQFEMYGILKKMTKNFEVERYTTMGDQLKIDFTYSFDVGSPSSDLMVPSGFIKVRRFVHAVSMKSNSNSVKALAYTWPQLQEGLAKKDQTFGQFTAVIEDDVDRNRDRVNYAVNELITGGIDVRQVSQMRDFAIEAKRELGL
jgi:hypothetical protein